MKYLIFLFFFSNQLYAQPGGGGGLKINHFFDENLREINLSKEIINIKMTLLDSTLTILNETKIKKNDLIYLPPLNRYRPSTQNRGLIIKYKNKNYRFDFENIISENGGGSVEEIDSLVLFKPYILSKRGYHHINHNGNEFLKYNILNDLSSSFLSSGITPYSYKKLSELDLMFSSFNFSYNRNPKKWMEDYKNLYADFRKGNFTHSEKEIIEFINRLDNIIKKNKPIPPFIFLKILLLNELNQYSEIISLFEKHKFKYSHQLYYLNNILILAYQKNKNYKKSILLSNTIANNLRETNKGRSYEYLFKALFVKVYYQNKNIAKEINRIIENEKYPQYYKTELNKLKILKAFNYYKFKSKHIGRIQMKHYSKKIIPDEIKKVMQIEIED